MGQAASRASKKTTLEWAFIEVPVALYNTVASTKETDRWSSKMIDPKTGKEWVEPASEVSAGADIGAAAVNIEMKGFAGPVQGDPLGEDAAKDEVPPQPRSGPVDASLFMPTTDDDLEPEEAEAEAVRHRGLDTPAGWVDVEEQILAIEAHTRLERMGVAGFVRLEQVDRSRIIGSYWVGPAGGGGSLPLLALYRACKAAGRGALVKWLKTKRQAIGVVVPHKSGALLCLELAWEAELQEPPETATGIQQADLRDDELEAAVDLLHSMDSKPLVIADQADDAVRLREQLRDLAFVGRADEFVVPRRPGIDEDANVVDLLGVLRESVEQADAFAA